MDTIPLTALRRHVVAWQGFTMRYLCATDDDVAECVRRLSCVQLDSIAAVERSHLLVLGARAGAVEPNAISRLLASGRLFEYWAHEASLLCVEDWPLLRRHMRERRTHHWWGPIIDSDPEEALLRADSDNTFHRRKMNGVCGRTGISSLSNLPGLARLCKRPA
jgi:uncharacterized protein YcaQ